MEQIESAHLPWLVQPWEQFIERAAKKMLPHALLINGPVGLGKKRFAEAIAAYQLCEKRAEMTTSCGQCKQCRLVQAESHPDLKWVQPEEGSASIKVDAIRDLVEFLSKSGMQGGYKVALVSPAEAMTHSAANALLKTLEEPTHNTLIILITHGAGRLLATIRSRCQAINLTLPQPSLSQSWLASQIEQDSTAISNALSMSYGSPLAALDYLNSNAIETLETMLAELALVLKRKMSVSEVAERWADDRTIERLMWMCQWLEQIISCQMTASDRFLRFAEADKMFRYLVENSDQSLLFALHQASLEQLRHLQGASNPNKTMVFELLLGQWLQLMVKSR